MKGDPRVIAYLNGYLQIELTGYRQYLVASAMAAHWGYEAIDAQQAAYVREEMEHAGMILRRILFLGGTPDTQTPAELPAASSVERQLRNDHALVHRAIVYLREGIETAVRAGDQATRELFTEMLVDEEHHLDWLTKQLGLIERLGTENYLKEQLRR